MAIVVKRTTSIKNYQRMDWPNGIIMANMVLLIFGTFQSMVYNLLRVKDMLEKRGVILHLKHHH